MPTPPPAANSSANSRSPRSSSDGELRRSGLRSPWVEIVVRGVGDSTDNDSTPPPLSKPVNVPAGEGSDKENGGNVGNKPSDGVSAAACATVSSDQGSGGATAVSTSATVVIGGDIAWPPLSESTRPSQKSSDSSKSTPDGSVSVSQGHVTSNSQQSKLGNANGNHSSGTHNGAPARQRLMTRGSNGGGRSRQGGFPRGPPAPSPPPVFPIPETVQSSFGNLVPVDSTPREPRLAGGFTSRPHAANDHRSSNRRANFGQHNRGDGRNNYRGSRRDEDHGNAHGHPQMPPPRGFMRPFAMPPAFRRYDNAMVYPDMPHLVYYPLPPDSIRAMHYFPGVSPSHPYVSTSEPPLHLSIVKQIDYYFSDDNLVKDEYLRSHMDENGWVTITLIASFPRVQNLTKNIALILQCLNKSSSIVQVQGDKVRRRNDWMKWITCNRPSSDSVIQRPVVSSTDDMLSSNFQKASLGEVNQDQASDVLVS